MNSDVFNKLKDESVSEQEKLKLLIGMVRIVNERATYGYYRDSKLQYLLGLLRAIIKAIQSGEATNVQLAAYFRKLEIEYKKFMYIFKLEGENSYIKNVVKEHLGKKEYVVDEYPSETFPYFVTLNFSGVENLEYSDDKIPVKSYLEKVYLKNVHYRINMKRYNEVSQAKVKAVITGLSYTYYAVNADMLTDKTLMLATPSQDIFYDFEMLKKAHEDHGDSLKYVIAGLCPYTLRYDLSQSKGVKDRALEYYQDFGTIHNYKPDVSDNLLRIEEAIIDAWGYDLIEEIYNHYIYPSFIMETGISTGQWAFDENCIPQSWINDIHSKTHKDFPETLEENKQILAQYMQFCVENNLKLFFLMPPFSNYYKNNWNNDYANELWQTIREIGKDVDYTILDFSDEEWENYYFGDYAHLNDIGAIRFTSMLDRVIQEELELATNS